jgi:hypothetical protein
VNEISKVQAVLAVTQLEGVTKLLGGSINQCTVVDSTGKCCKRITIEYEGESLAELIAN